MRSVLFAPHNLGDDETLFAAFTVCKLRPVVLTVLRSFTQDALGVTYHEREAETHLATIQLGASMWKQWEFPDVDTPWADVAKRIRGVAANTAGHAYAPLPEPGGHPDHDRVGEFVLSAFGADRTSFYATYKYGGPKTRTSHEVVPEPPWITRKLKALACYQSQIERGPRRFFMHDLNEYLAP